MLASDSNAYTVASEHHEQRDLADAAHSLYILPAYFLLSAAFTGGAQNVSYPLLSSAESTRSQWVRQFQQ